MRKERFEYLCKEAEAGRDAFVRNLKNHEEGMIAGCDLEGGRILVQTPDSEKRLWDFSDCDTLEHPKMGPML